MIPYIDAFVFPLATKHLSKYQRIANEVAHIWKEHGALSYQEFLGDDLHLDGTQSFTESLELSEDETVIFGWVAFPSKEVRDAANKAVPNDPRMEQLVESLVTANNPIFNARRMLYGGFKSFVEI